jgi:hypothetical protein
MHIVTFAFSTLLLSLRGLYDPLAFILQLFRLFLPIPSGDITGGSLHIWYVLLLLPTQSLLILVILAQGTRL